jgi:hypothetical protein
MSLGPDETPSADCTCQAAAPWAGFVEVATRPSASTVAQKDVVGHETGNALTPGTRKNDHADALPVGFAEAAIRPSKSAVTHNRRDAHDIVVST